MEKYKLINVFTDGGSRGNPGLAATGVYIMDENGHRLDSFGNFIGVNTNNVAEYTAVIEAYDWLIARKSEFDPKTKINFYMDSKLVCMQMRGLFKIKNENLRQLVIMLRHKETELGLQVSYSHIPREKNKEADKMVNKALDEHLKV